MFQPFDYLIEWGNCMIALPHFWHSMLHSQSNIDFCPIIEPAKYFFVLTCVHLIMSCQYVIFKVNFNVKNQFSPGWFSHFDFLPLEYWNRRATFINTIF